MNNNIKSERNRIDLTQGQLAEKLSVDEGTVRRWERGETPVPSTKAMEMSNLFGCSVDYLFGVTNERLRKEVAQ